MAEAKIACLSYALASAKDELARTMEDANAKATEAGAKATAAAHARDLSDAEVKAEVKTLGAPEVRL